MNSPAFLFYSKDWIADTADWEPEAKGVYIDLLAHQHVNGSLPSDMTKLARVARLSLDEFSRIWKDIKHKFDQEGDHVVNHRLNQVVNDNRTKALKNKINGCFAAKVKILNISAKHLLEIKRSFDYEMFACNPEDEIKDNVYQWVDQMVNQVVHQADYQTDNNLLSAFASPNNKKEEVKKKGKSFSPPSLKDFLNYFKENGYSEELAERAFKGYEVANWRDSKGDQVKNWQQKCQHVWFKPENKKNGKPYPEILTPIRKEI